MPFIGKQPAAGNFKKLDTITGSGATAYTLQYNAVNFLPGVAESLIVSVNGVIQSPGTAFTVSDFTITFSEAITGSDNIDFIIAMGEVAGTITVSDASVTAAKLAADLVVTSVPIRINSNTLTENVTIASSKNASIIGPVTIDSTVTIDGTLTVI